MRSFLLDPSSGDIGFDGQGDIRMVDDADQDVQALRLRVQTVCGEWFLDESFGTAWRGILGERYNEAVARAEVSKAILAEPRVARIESLSLTFDQSARSLAVAFKAILVTGEAVSEEVLVA